MGVLPRQDAERKRGVSDEADPQLIADLLGLLLLRPPREEGELDLGGGQRDASLLQL